MYAKFHVFHLRRRAYEFSNHTLIMTVYVHKKSPLMQGSPWSNQLERPAHNPNITGSSPAGATKIFLCFYWKADGKYSVYWDQRYHWWNAGVSLASGRTDADGIEKERLLSVLFEIMWRHNVIGIFWFICIFLQQFHETQYRIFTHLLGQAHYAEITIQAQNSECKVFHCIDIDSI